MRALANYPKILVVLDGPAVRLNQERIVRLNGNRAGFGRGRRARPPRLRFRAAARAAEIPPPFTRDALARTRR